MPPKPQQLTTGLHYHCFIGKQWTFLKQNNIKISTKTLQLNAPKFIYSNKIFEEIFPKTPTERSAQ